MAEEISLVREYEAIIKTMKEQINVLKGKIVTAKAENRSFSVESAGDKSQLSILGQRASKVDALGQELRAAHELIQKLHSDKRHLEKKLDVSCSRDPQRQGLASDGDAARAKTEAEIKRLKVRVEELKRENDEMKKDLDIGRSGKYEDLSSTQKTRHLVIERKIRVIEAENKALKEKLVTLEMEKRQFTEKTNALAEKLQDYELNKAKIRRANEDLQVKETTIASLTEQIRSLSPGKARNVDLTKANLEDYKAQLQNQRTSHNPVSPQTRSPRTTPGVRTPRDSTDMRLSEIVMELRKTQEQVATLTKASAERRNGSPRDLSFEGNNFEDSRQTERKRPALPAEVPKSPSHQEVLKSTPHLTPIAETPMLTKLQLLRGVKKTSASAFKPTSSRRGMNEASGVKGQVPSPVASRTKVLGR